MWPAVRRRPPRSTASSGTAGATASSALGEIDADEIARAVRWSPRSEPIPVEVDELLLGGQWDLVISIGQVVPHEVIGMANFTKNLVIGLGGAPTIHRSHFLGAVCDLETIMGRGRHARPRRGRRVPSTASSRRARSACSGC